MTKQKLIKAIAYRKETIEFLITLAAKYPYKSKRITRRAADLMIEVEELEKQLKEKDVNG